MENDNMKKECGRGTCPRGKLFATNWLDGISSGGDFDIVQVVFKNTRMGFYTNPNRLDLKIGDMVAVEGSPGHDIGRVSMIGRLVRLQMRKANISDDTELKRVFRFASQSDLEKATLASAREEETMIQSRQIAKELGLDMKIGDVEYQGDGGKAIFYYIADERVDFRKLIRVLADTFKVRIEMKQIGARQEAGRIGGIGPCGRPLCCSSWMTHFVSVGTGSARIQDLSMNPQKLAGQCAKLKCCLNFEIDTYSEAHRQLPNREINLETKDATYYFFKADILERKLTYSTDKTLPVNLETIDASRAFEIIALNKQGIKVDSLSIEESEQTNKREYTDLVEQESLTRFDSSKKKKRKGQRDSDRDKTRQNSIANSDKGRDRTKDSRNAPRDDKRSDRRRQNRHSNNIHRNGNNSDKNANQQKKE